MWVPDLEAEPASWDAEVTVGGNAAPLRYLVAYASNWDDPGATDTVSYDDIRFLVGYP